MRFHHHAVRIILFLIIWGAVSGCVTSKYHRGYYYAAEKDIYSNVSSRVDKDVDKFEHECASAIANYDFLSLQKYFSPQLKTNLTIDTLNELNVKLKNMYAFSSQISRVELEDKRLPGLRDAVDNYDVYDFITGAYKLEGNPGARLIIYSTKINGELKLCGFRIDSNIDQAEKDNTKLLYGGRRIELSPVWTPISILLQILGMGQSFFYSSQSTNANLSSGDVNSLSYVFPETKDKYGIFSDRFGTFYEK